MTNVLVNAVKYSHEDASVVLTVRREADRAVLSVRDEGVGIPKAELAHGGEPFYRASNVVGEYPGSGLGLASVRSIVEAHGGNISLQSTEGTGTTVTVCLPVGVSGDAGSGHDGATEDL